jgi:hypothetical protein
MKTNYSAPALVDLGSLGVVTRQGKSGPYCDAVVMTALSMDNNAAPGGLGCAM